MVMISYVRRKFQAITNKAYQRFQDGHLNQRMIANASNLHTHVTYLPAEMVLSC